MQATRNEQGVCQRADHRCGRYTGHVTLRHPRSVWLYLCRDYSTATTELSIHRVHQVFGSAKQAWAPLCPAAVHAGNRSVVDGLYLLPKAAANTISGHLTHTHLARPTSAHDQGSSTSSFLSVWAMVSSSHQLRAGIVLLALLCILSGRGSASVCSELRVSN